MNILWLSYVLHSYMRFQRWCLKEGCDPLSPRDIAHERPEGVRFLHAKTQELPEQDCDGGADQWWHCRLDGGCQCERQQVLGCFWPVERDHKKRHGIDDITVAYTEAEWQWLVQHDNCFSLNKLSAIRKYVCKLSIKIELNMLTGLLQLKKQV